MTELSELAGDLPPELQVDGAAADDGADDGADDEEEVVAGAEDEEEDEGADDGAGAKPKKGAAADDEEDDDEDLETAFGDDEEEDDPKPPAAVQPPAAVAADPEANYILTNLPKISVNVLMPTADGKGQETKTVQVYGWGDMPKNMLGFVSAYEQGVFTSSAQNNETKARELQNNFRQQKVQADTEAYTMRENKAIARDLKTLRTEGLFPKFKGVPGTKDFNDSEGAKEFDRVVAFMNEQNDEAGQAAQKGDAFYHISFRQAYRMLHPEKFDTKAIAARKNGEKAVARRVKSGGGGTPPKPNIQTARVSNINDLASEFDAFAGSAK